MIIRVLGISGVFIRRGGEAKIILRVEIRLAQPAPGALPHWGKVIQRSRRQRAATGADRRQSKSAKNLRRNYKRKEGKMVENRFRQPAKYPKDTNILKLGKFDMPGGGGRKNYSFANRSGNINRRGRFFNNIENRTVHGESR